ncbi:MAG TPA: M23 family metallopeptidase [Gemmatimonadaceae bacterium]|nr:M23 family metallopeptidase [Gemmatimonadaceae bacterium]
MTNSSLGVARRNAMAVALFALFALAGCGASIRPLEPLPAPAPAPESYPSGGTASVPVDAEDISYFDANPLMVPVEGVQPSGVSDSFNDRRDNGRTHRASDILVPKGTPVVAAESGTIMRLSRNALGGITIYMMDESGRFIFYYAHLEGYADGLVPKEHVLQGDLLGYVGMTGNAPVPHLHFQAMRRDPNRRDYWNSPAVDVRTFFTIPGKVRASDEQQR